MSEFVVKVRETPKAAAILAALSLLASGCLEKQSGYADGPVIPRCYSHPQPKLFDLREPKIPSLKPNESVEQLDKEWKAYNKEADRADGILPTMKLPVNDGFTEGDPIYLPGLEDKVDRSIVQLETSKWSGSGFLTEDDKGQEVVVTAAHVVDNARMRSIKITGENHVSTHPIGGCYIYEEGGKFKPLNDNSERPVDIDLAILKLAKPIGRNTLKLSRADAKRGDWVEFSNYQTFHEPGDPANYTGVIISGAHDLLGLTALTGTEKVDKPVTEGELQEIETFPGASGGAVTNLNGEVVGVSVAANKDGVYADQDMLDVYGVKMPGAKFGIMFGFVPKTADLVPSSVLKKGLRSRRA